MHFHIRDYQRSDAEALADLFRAAVRQISARDYSAAQVDAWAGGVSAERLGARLGDGRTALVAVGDSDAPLAFGDLEADGHIDFLYAAPDAAGKGIAAALYDALESHARAQDMTRLYTEASEAARRFFLKKGFAVVTRRDFVMGSTPMHNYAMEKRL
ncbi:MAG: GNAT family N-acetyltransferase [Proteobacteria bacterium]|nr:GNAT family N-acetyltransferase [Pseudomonadota bacterium]